MAVLLTGGAGYIGSHTVIELIQSGYEVVVCDNFYNANPAVIDRVKQITNKDFKLYSLDLNDRASLRQLFKEEEIESVIHLAGMKSVGESAQIPLKYYRGNIGGTLTLLEEMDYCNIKNLVFSSSATVYGPENPVPYVETQATSATNPYGYTKVAIERILQDLYQSDQNYNILCLRYFNPLGAHDSGLIGEDPKGVPNNILPFMTQVAVGRLKELKIFGNDFDTPDGTGVRDYIHVVDLAKGHGMALKKLSQNPGFDIYNLGTGAGVSVLELVQIFEKVTGVKIPYEIVGRRKGDLGSCYADVTKAEKELGFAAEKSIEDMLRDSWLWQKNNPNGFDKG